MRLAILLAAFALAATLASAADPLQPANALYFDGNPKGALAAYEGVFAETGSPEAALNAATVSQEIGRHRHAIGVLEDAYRRHPDHRDIRADLAWALLNEGLVDRARDHFEAIVSSGNATWLETLGYAEAIRAAEGGDRAEPLYLAVIEARPFLTLAYYLLGRLYEERERLDEAVERYLDVMKRDSHFIEPRPRLARLYEALNQPNEAWRQYARITTAFSGHPSAADGMKRLRDKITEEPSAMLPSKKIDAPTPVPPIARVAGLPVLKIGIGTTSRGNPAANKDMAFRTSAPFRIEDDRSGRVLFEGPARETWRIRLTGGTAELLNASGAVRLSFRDPVFIRVSETDGTLIINSLRYADGMPWGGMADKELRGELRVIVDRSRDRLVLVNHVNIEAYVYGVLAAEMPSHWPLEALKSQAVLARNLALYRMFSYRPHRRHGYDLCDEQHCQVYAGVRVENDKVRRAVDETRGEILSYRGKVAHTVFSSNCGGQTQTGRQAGWGDVPYWESVSDRMEGEEAPETPWAWKRFLQSTPNLYCRNSPHIWFPEYRWTRVVPAADIGARVGKRRDLGRIRQIYILGRNRSGRVTKVQVVGTKGSLTFTKEHEIRRYLGLGLQRSTQFALETVVRDHRAERFVFYGGGWGHGVGFCQSGAAGRADAGFGYREILATYFPKTELETHPDNVSLPPQRP